MKLVLISDTHTLHARLGIQPCDLLIHAGDFTARGSLEESKDFLDWFEKQPAKHRVMIAGNHDFVCERDPKAFRGLLGYRSIHYLNDSGVELEGMKIWGSPVTPMFFNWAFNRDRGPQIRKHWDLIPCDTDILVTHGPPLCLGDRTSRGETVGCGDLRATVEAIAPRLHVFGHIHEARGSYRRQGLRTEFFNVACLSRGHDHVRSPVVKGLPPGAAAETICT